MSEQLHIDKRKSLWAIAFVSFFWSTSSLMIFSLLPVFISDVLMVSKKSYGHIEGIAVFIAFVFKVFAGLMSDYTKKRKPLIVLGSFLTFMIKPLFALSVNATSIFVARFLDRVSKGIRSSPTDALIADLSTKSDRGRNYGLRQALYILGEVAGAIMATALMIITHQNYRVIFWTAAIPAVIAFIILVFFVKAPPITSEDPVKRPHWKLSHVKVLPRRFWGILGVTSILMLARFSEGFVSLRAREIGWSVDYLPIMLVIMNMVHASSAYPIGLFADKTNRLKILLPGIAFLIVGNICLIAATNIYWIIAGVLAVGLHMGTTQSLLAALIADSTPSDLRGTAFSLYYLTAGTAVLIGNSIAGQLSHTFGLIGAFRGGLVFSSLACLALWLMMRPNLNR